MEAVGTDRVDEDVETGEEGEAFEGDVFVTLAEEVEAVQFYRVVTTIRGEEKGNAVRRFRDFRGLKTRLSIVKTLKVEFPSRFTGLKSTRDVVKKRCAALDVWLRAAAHGAERGTPKDRRLVRRFLGLNTDVDDDDDDDDDDDVGSITSASTAALGGFGAATPERRRPAGTASGKRSLSTPPVISEASAADQWSRVSAPSFEGAASPTPSSDNRDLRRDLDLARDECSRLGAESEKTALDLSEARAACADLERRLAALQIESDAKAAHLEQERDEALAKHATLEITAAADRESLEALRADADRAQEDSKGHVEQARRDCEAVTAARDELLATNAALEKARDELDAKAARLEQERDAALAKHATLEAAAIADRESLEALRADADRAQEDLKGHIEQARRDCEAVTVERDDLLSTNAALEKARNELDAKAARLEQERDAALAKHATLEATAIADRDSLEALRADADRAQEDSKGHIEQARRDCEAVTAARDELLATNSALEKARDELDAKAARLEQERDAALAKHATLEAAAIADRESLEALRADADRAQEDSKGHIEQARRDCEAVTAARDELLATNSVLEKARDELDAKAARLEQERDAALAKHAMLEAAAIADRESLEALRADADRAQEDSKGHIEQARRDCEAVTAARDELLSTNSALEKARDELDAKAARLEQERDAALAKHATLEAAAIADRESLEALRADADRAQEDSKGHIEQARRDCEAVTAERDDLLSTNAALEMARNELDAKAARLEQERDDALARHATLEAAAAADRESLEALRADANRAQEDSKGHVEQARRDYETVTAERDELLSTNAALEKARDDYAAAARELQASFQASRNHLECEFRATADEREKTIERLVSEQRDLDFRLDQTCEQKEALQAACDALRIDLEEARARNDSVRDKSLSSERSASRPPRDVVSPPDTDGDVVAGLEAQVARLESEVTTLRSFAERATLDANAREAMLVQKITTVTSERDRLLLEQQRSGLSRVTTFSEPGSSSSPRPRRGPFAGLFDTCIGTKRTAAHDTTP